MVWQVWSCHRGVVMSYRGQDHVTSGPWHDFLEPYLEGLSRLLGSAMSLFTLHHHLLLRSISEIRRKCSSGLGSLKPFSILWPRQAKKPLPPRRKLDDEDITGSYLKGWGPGGQKIVWDFLSGVFFRWSLIPLSVRDLSGTIDTYVIPQFSLIGFEYLEQNQFRSPTDPSTNRHCG